MRGHCVNFSFLITFVLAILYSFTNRLAADDTEIAKRIEALVAPYVKATHFSGVIIASKDGKVVLEKAYGLANAEHAIQNKTNTCFGIASVTKHMTKAIAIRLAEQGKLGLQDKLSKYIPDFPNGDNIDILLLLRHRAGIRHRVTQPSEEAVAYSAADMTEKARIAPLAFEADGNKRLYSSAGYSVLVRVLELASGKSYSDLLQELIFDPLEMNHSVDFDGEKIIKNRAQEYLLRPNEIVHAPLKDYSFLIGAGSVFSTAQDIYNFGNGVLDGKLGPNVSASLVDGEGVYDDNGNTNGFRCYFKFDRNAGYGFVLMANLESGANDMLVEKLQRILSGDQVAREEIPSPQIDRAANRALGDFVGVYESNFNELEITLSDGSIFAGRLQLSPTGRDTFFSFGKYATIQFVRDADNRVTGLQWEDSYGKSDWVRKNR